ncbi:MAG: response regulator [Candidatus Eremiobacterota bacterium]
MSDLINILLVEDDEGDAELTREALEDSKLAINLHIVRDGVEAINYLYRKEPYIDAPLPDLILLDLNMPKKSGREVLAEIKQDETLKDIPVIILTTSQVGEDILRSYNLGANCYITKPVDFAQFVNVIKNVEDFWFTIVKLPSRYKKC